jgi:hypothetical protein
MPGLDERYREHAFGRHNFALVLCARSGRNYSRVS